MTPSLTTACEDIGLEPGLAIAVLTRCLAEQLAEEIRLPDHLWYEERKKPNGLDLFIERIERKTQRFWPQEDARAIRDLIDRRIASKYRTPPDLGTKLAMIFNRELACSRCGRKPPDVGLELDHLYPWAKGGTNELKNLQFLCKACNIAKSDKVSSEFKNIN